MSAQRTFGWNVTPLRRNCPENNSTDLGRLIWNRSSWVSRARAREPGKGIGRGALRLLRPSEAGSSKPNCRQVVGVPVAFATGAPLTETAILQAGTARPGDVLTAHSCRAYSRLTFPNPSSQIADTPRWIRVRCRKGRRCWGGGPFLTEKVLTFTKVGRFYP